MGALVLTLTKGMKHGLRGHVFRQQEIVGLNLACADLRDVRFEEVQFTSCDLAGADLRGAHFILCTLSSTVLRDVRLGDNRFYGTTLVEPIELQDDARQTIERSGGVFLPSDIVHHPTRRGDSPVGLPDD